MSRCFPFLSTGKLASNEHLIVSIKLQEGIENSIPYRAIEKLKPSDKKKDGTREKKLKKNDQDTFYKDDIVQEERKAKRSFEVLDRSNLTEEHGRPIIVQNVSCSSDSTGNSSKRQRLSSPGNSVQGKRSIIRLRLSSKKTDAPSTPAGIPCENNSTLQSVLQPFSITEPSIGLKEVIPKAQDPSIVQNHVMSKAQQPYIGQKHVMSDLSTPASMPRKDNSTLKRKLQPWSNTEASNGLKGVMPKAHETSIGQKTVISQAQQPSISQKHMIYKVREPFIGQKHVMSKPRETSSGQKHVISKGRDNPSTSSSIPRENNSTLLRKLQPLSTTEPSNVTLLKAQEPSIGQKSVMSRAQQPSIGQKSVMSQAQQPSIGQKHVISKAQEPFIDQRHLISKRRDDPSTSANNRGPWSITEPSNGLKDAKAKKHVMSQAQQPSLGPKDSIPTVVQQSFIPQKEVLPKAQEYVPTASTSTATLGLAYDKKIESVAVKDGPSSIRAVERSKSPVKKLSSHERKMIKMESMYNKLFENFAPPKLESGILVDQEVDNDWLFGKKNAERPAKRLREGGDDAVQANLACSSSAVLQPRAQFLPDVGIYALPFTIPF